MIGVCWSVIFLAGLPTGIADQCQNVGSCQDGVSQYRCACPHNYTAGEAGCVCFNTSAVYQYTVLHDKGAQIQYGQTSIQFEVKACSDAHVLLMKSCTEQNNGVYEIVIGGWSNTMSVIRTAMQQTPAAVAFMHNERPLNCNKSKSFWIDWKDYVIKVGCGSYAVSNEFLNLTCSNNLKINYVAISTWNGIHGEWMFNASQSKGCTTASVTGNIEPQTVSTSTSNILTSALTTGNTMTSLAEDTATTQIGGTGTTDIQTLALTTGNTTTSSTDHNSTCMCPCHPWYKKTEQERAMYLRTAIEQLKKELTMEKKNLSSVTRKNTSARDERVSAKIMGCSLGVCVLMTVFGSIIIGDLVRLGRFIWERFQ